MTDVSHMLPEHVQRKKSGAGPVVGIVIVVFLLIIGALYFWGAALNAREQEPLPLIPGDAQTS